MHLVAVMCANAFATFHPALSACHDSSFPKTPTRILTPGMVATLDLLHAVGVQVLGNEARAVF